MMVNLPPSSQYTATNPAIVRVEATMSAASVRRREEWDSVDSDLVDWLNDPSGLVEPGAVAPSRSVIRIARDLIRRIRDQNSWPAPAMVVPDNFGGLTFEFHSGGAFRTLDIDSRGKVTTTIFRKGKPTTPVTLN